jgi:hypothetical protein
MTGQTKDGLELKDDGTITLRLDDDVVINMRVPRLKEFRTIKRKAFEQGAALQERAEAAGVSMQELNSGTTDPSRALLLEQMIDESMDATIGVIRDAVEMLGDATLPDDDDLPTWLCTNNGILSSFMTHWRTVPLDRG